MTHAEERTAVALRLCLALFVAASGAYYVSPPFADNDLWGHVYFGDAVLKSGHLPTTNQYSFTAPDYPWINHEILAECLFALVFSRLGSPGLLGVKLVVGLATLGVLARAASRRSPHPLACAAALVVCASLMSWGFLVRPQIFTFLALAVVWERLRRWDDTRSWRSLAILPLLFGVWVNTHGGVAAGIGVLFIYVAARCRSLEPSQRAPLVAIAALSLLALLVNPYGINLPIFLARDLLLSRQITEWEPLPPLTVSSPLQGVVLVYAATLALLVVGIFVNREKQPWELLVLGIAALATFRHQRHLPLFAIVATPFLAETIGSAGDVLGRGARIATLSATATGLLAFGIFGVALLQFARLVSLYSAFQGQIFVSPLLFPVSAVGFIQRNQLRGNLVLPFDWGEYAIWHLYPGCRVSVDGRYTTAYPDEVLDQSFRFLSGEPLWQSSLEGADIVLLDRRQPIVREMFGNADWQYVYSDNVALVFVRKTASTPNEWNRRPRPMDADTFVFP